MPNTLNPTDNPELYEVASFGKYVSDFWDSELGQYLLQRALEDYNMALEEFQGCDPTDFKKIATIQVKMRQASNFRDWLSLPIAEGAKALRIIEGHDNEEA